jgi:hypothetical protein
MLCIFESRKQIYTWLDSYLCDSFQRQSLLIEPLCYCYCYCKELYMTYTQSELWLFVWILPFSYDVLAASLVKIFVWTAKANKCGCNSLKMSQLSGYWSYSLPCRQGRWCVFDKSFIWTSPIYSGPPTDSVWERSIQLFLGFRKWSKQLPLC